MALPGEILSCLSRHQRELVELLEDWQSRMGNHHELQVAEATQGREKMTELPIMPLPIKPMVEEPMNTVTFPAHEFISPTEETEEGQQLEETTKVKPTLPEDSVFDIPVTPQLSNVTPQLSNQSYETVSPEEEIDFLPETTKRWRHLYTRLLKTLNGEQQVYVHDRWIQEAKNGSSQDLDDFAAMMLREVLEEKQQAIFDASSSEVGTRVKLAWCSLLRIHPNGPTRLVWVFLALLMCIMEFIVVPIEIVHTLPETTAYLVLSWTGLIFWTADIFVNFVTGVFVAEVLHMDLPTIAKDYTTTWFPLDVTIVGLEWMSNFLGMDASAVSILKSMRVFRLVKLLRVGKLYKLLQDVMLHQLSYFGDLVVVWKLCMLYLGGLHLIACFWWSIRQLSDSSHDFTVALGIDVSDVYNAYIVSMEWAVGFLVGMSPDVRFDNSIEVSVAVVLQFLGVLALATFTSRMVVLVQLLVNHDERELQAACSSYLLTHAISPMLAKVTTKSLDIHHAGHRMSLKLAKEQKFLGKLPRYLQINLREEAFGHTLANRDFFEKFQELHHTAFRHLCFEALAENVVKKGDVVFNAGQSCFNMKFVRTGSFTYTLSALTHTRQAKNLRTMLRSSLRATEGTTHAQAGDALSEAVLWMSWFHTGKLQATTYSLMLELSADKFGEVISNYRKPYRTAVGYAHKFVSQQQKNPGMCTDFSSFMIDFSDLEIWMPSEEDFADHYMFLSHFKAEAGTEAVLLQEAMTKLIKEDRSHTAYRFKDPVFLDSDNLVDLTQLTEHLLKTHNLVLLLTPGVFERPWCLVEIVTAVRQNLNIVPVEISRPGLRYVYPTEEFFRKFRTGSFLSQADYAVLRSNDISLLDAEDAIRHVFTKITVSFSPHKSQDIRMAEIVRIIQRCAARQHIKAVARSGLPSESSGDRAVRRSSRGSSNPESAEDMTFRRSSHGGRIKKRMSSVF